MLRNNFTHGFSTPDWEAAKEEACSILIDRAKNEGQITYSELVTHIRRIRLEARDPRLFVFLGEIAIKEDTAGRGMLTAIVVHKSGDMKPGRGFFELAKQLGRDVSDEDKCWMAELASVYAYWAEN